MELFKFFGTIGIDDKQAQKALDNIQKKANQFGQKMNDVGTKMSNVGQSLTTAISVPLAGIATVATKTAMNMESAQDKMQASLGLTAQEAEELGDVAQNMWKQAFGQSMEDVTNAVTTVRQNIQELNNAQLEDITKKALILRDTFDADVAESTRTASVMMKNFGIEVADAMDLMTVGFQKGGNFSDELLDTMREYSPMFSNMGHSAEDMMNILIAGAEAGAWNLDKVGDAVKEFNIRAKDGSKTTAEGFALIGLNAEEMGAAIAEGGTKGENAFQATIAALAAMEYPVQQNIAGVALFGTQWEDLEKDVVSAMGTAENKLGDFRGATDEAGEALRGNFGTRFTETMRSLGSALEPIGTIILDIANDALPYITSAIDKVESAFNSLSPAGQKVVVVLGGIAMAIPPLLMVGGTLVTGLAGIATAFGGATVAGGAFAGVMAVITSPITLTVAAIAGLVASVVILYNKWDDLEAKIGSFGMKILTVTNPIFALTAAVRGIKDMFNDSIPEVDLFGDEVSESTQKAVGSFMDLNDKATVALNELAWSGQSVSGEMKDTVVSNFSQMTSQVITGLQEQKTEATQTMQEMFENSKDISEQEQQEILANIEEGYDQRVQATEQGNQRIQEIMTTAAQENRAITEQEQQEINAIQQEMVDTGVEVLTENEREQKVILEKMRQQADEISARQAAEVVQNSVKQKDEVIAEAEDQYDKTVAEIIKLRDETGTISAEQADKLIEEATRQRDETITQAEEMHEKVVEEAQEQAGEHVDEVDWSTGEILSKWEVLKNETLAKMGEIGTGIKQTFVDAWVEAKQSATELKNDVVAKWEEIKTEAKEKFEQAKENILTPIEEAKNTISGWIGEIKGFFDGLELKIPEIKLPKLPKFNISGDFSLNPPSVPKIDVDFFAKGTNYAKGGLAVVGEYGRELVNLPKGSQVVPAHKTEKLLEDASGNNGGNTFTNHITINADNASPAEIDRRFRRTQEKLAMNWGLA